MITAIDKKRLLRPGWLPKNVWPFETFGLMVDGSQQLAVTDVGTGPVLLFVHTGVWSFIWRDLIKRLSTDYRCICFDAPGNGRSSSASPAETTLERAADATVGLIRLLDLHNFTLIAHDLGGISGLAAAARVPQLVQGIVAMNTFGWKPDITPFRAMLRIMGSVVVREIDVLTNFMSWIGSSSFGAGRYFDAASRQAFREGAGNNGRRSFHRYMRNALACDALYPRIQAAIEGPFARLPFLTVFGERNDPFGFQDRWKELFPQAVQVVVPAGNHFPMCDDPDLVAHAVRSWHKEKIAHA